jgi:proline racemase
MQSFVEVPGLGAIAVDVAYGGMMYVIVSAIDLGFTLERSEARSPVEVGEHIKLSEAEQLPSVQAGNPSSHTINQTLFAGPVTLEEGVKRSKNAVVVSPGRIDRSPCGSGSAARMALIYARGELAVGETFKNYSLLDTEFTCSIVAATRVGEIHAVVTNIGGRARLTGISHYGLILKIPFRMDIG